MNVRHPLILKTLLFSLSSLILLPIGVSICKTFHSFPTNPFIASLLLPLSDMLYGIRVLLAPYTASLYLRKKFIYFLLDFLLMSSALVARIVHFSSLERPGLALFIEEYGYGLLFMMALPMLCAYKEVNIIKTQLGSVRSDRNV